MSCRHPPKGGTITNNGDGTVDFDPKRGFRGTDTFTYTVQDLENATSNAATVQVNVSSHNAFGVGRAPAKNARPNVFGQPEGFAESTLSG